MNQRAQSSLEYLMTYGWAMILISTVVGVLAFVVVSPTENFQCVVSQPTKFLMKGVNVPASTYDAPGDYWVSRSDSPEHTKIILQNVTGGKIIITSVEAFSNTPCEEGQEDYLTNDDTFVEWCPYWDAMHTAGQTEEGWVDIAWAYGSFINNAFSTSVANPRMKINGINQSHDDTQGSGNSMCREGANVDVPAGGEIEITDFSVTPPTNCGVTGAFSAPRGNEPGKFRLNYTDQFGFDDSLEITCMGLPRRS